MDTLFSVILLTCLGTGFLLFSQRKLIRLANTRFDAWGNLLDQQQRLLESIALLLQIQAKNLPKPQRSELIEELKALIALEDTQIEAIGQTQQTVIFTLLAALDATNDQLDNVEDFEQWLACQDSLMSSVDEIWLAQQHYNEMTLAYNQWRDHFWVYWMAERLNYAWQPMIRAFSWAPPADETDSFQTKPTA